jgi:hypothetical protein
MATVRFTMAEGMVLTADLAMFCSRFEDGLFEEWLFYEQEDTVKKRRKPLYLLWFFSLLAGLFDNEDGLT